MDDLSVKFHGFQPSFFARTFVSDRLNSLLDEAPYGASMNATFSRRDGLFRAVVQIHSSAGRFFAMASSRKLKDVNHKVVFQLRKQFERWKSRRFETNKNLKKEVHHDNDSVA